MQGPQGSWVQSLGREDPLKGMATPAVFLPGKSHGDRSLAGCSPRGHKRVGCDQAAEPQRDGPWVGLGPFWGPGIGVLR